MIAFIGDVHDEVEALVQVVAALPPQAVAIIQVGDLVLHTDLLTDQPGARPPRPIYFIDGNHHTYPMTRGLRRPTEVLPGYIFLPRGTVLALDGRRVAFLGGGDSVVDCATRRPGIDWWPAEEAIGPADEQRFRTLAPRSIDLLVTHTPPASVTTAMTGAVPHPSAMAVERVWQHLGRPALVCGHMHRSFRWQNAQVLAFLEVTFR